MYVAMLIQNCVLQGDHIAEAVLQKNSPATAISWHPTRKILAVGWESGEIQIWNETEKEMYEVLQLHRRDITALQWTSNGTRLLTTDKVIVHIQTIDNNKEDKMYLETIDCSVNTV